MLLLCCSGNVLACVFNDLTVVGLFSLRYVRALGAMYMRLTGTAMDCYKYLEPLYYDYRKLRRMNRDGSKAFIFLCQKRIQMAGKHVVWLDVNCNANCCRLVG